MTLCFELKNLMNKITILHDLSHMNLSVREPKKVYFKKLIFFKLFINKYILNF